MSKKYYIKGFISGALVVLLTANIVFAATTSKSIKVTFDNIKIIFDGVEKIPSADSKPITYNGKIYIPLDYVAKSIGKSYKFDSKSKIAYVGADKKRSSTGIDVKTSDQSAQLTFPKEWKAAALSQQMTLNYSDGSSGFIVVRDSKSALSSDASLEDYNSIVTGNMTKLIENASTTEPISVKINGYSALQFELRGEAQKVKLAYLCTIVETNDSYYRLLAYSSEDLFDKYKASYIKITNSFKKLSE